MSGLRQLDPIRISDPRKSKGLVAHSGTRRRNAEIRYSIRFLIRFDPVCRERIAFRETDPVSRSGSVRRGGRVP